MKTGTLGRAVGVAVLACSLNTALAGGIPVIDPTMLNNDITQWIQDSMTELEHHIKDYEMIVQQYETMYNQFTYLQNQYRGLVDGFSNIHNAQDILKTYNHALEMYNGTINAYNNFANTTNQNFANICGKLESKTLDASACSAEVQKFLADMNETNERIRKDNDPNVEGSTANSIQKDQQALEELHRHNCTGNECKEGQVLNDVRSYAAIQADQLNKMRIQQQQTTNEIRLLRADLNAARAQEMAEEEKIKKTYKQLESQASTYRK